MRARIKSAGRPTVPRLYGLTHPTPINKTSTAIFSREKVRGVPRLIWPVGRPARTRRTRITLRNTKHKYPPTKIPLPVRFFRRRPALPPRRFFFYIPERLFTENLCASVFSPPSLFTPATTLETFSWRTLFGGRGRRRREEKAGAGEADGRLKRARFPTDRSPISDNDNVITA